VTSLASSVRSRAPLLAALTTLVFGAGCAASGAGSEEDVAASEGAQVASAVVVASPAAIAVAEVSPDQVRIPGAAADRYRALAPGTVFVGARGATTGKNPDGFLRRVVSVTSDGGGVVVTTKPALLTDAIVRGAVRASSAGGSGIDDHDLGESSLRPLGRETMKGIAIDFSDKPLFDGVDEVDVAGGKARFVESVRLESAVLTSKPVVDFDLGIEAGHVNRFVAKIEGNFDASIRARASVVGEGDVNEATMAELASRKHDVEIPVYASSRVALPTFAVGGVPVSPSVAFTVTLRCGLSFGGPLEAEAGVEARSQVRLGGTFAGGAWAPPTRSDFDIQPSFAMQKGGEIKARCELDASAELFLYGVPGLTLSVAPYVDFDVKRASGTASHRYRVNAGATGTLGGRADIFGIRLTDLGGPLAEWSAPDLLEGTVK